jgi:hypothetical protein
VRPDLVPKEEISPRDVPFLWDAEMRPAADVPGGPD